MWCFLLFTVAFCRNPEIIQLFQILHRPILIKVNHALLSVNHRKHKSLQLRVQALVWADFILNQKELQKLMLTWLTTAWHRKQGCCASTWGHCPPQIKLCPLLEQRKYGKLLHYSQNQSSCGCSHCQPWANSLNQMSSDFLKGWNILGFAGCAVSALHLWLESSHKQ